MKFLPKKHEPQDLNISPLIDMVFLLIIFFAVSSTFVKDMKIDINRPQAKNSVLASTKSVRIYLDRDGVPYMNDQPVKMWMLQSMVREAMDTSTSRSVLVVADRLTATEKLVEVVDQAKLGGADEVGVATEAR
ncbi:MAG: biopolymer transporter ExbD [Spirochaetales bacterium]|nr:biopolymer transporter ExbD [Spirochaetales bacterium]